MKKRWNVEGEPTSEFLYVNGLSSRDAIIYIANKYKEEILFKNFLKNTSDYKLLANDFGVTPKDLFMYFTYKLKVNDMVNKFDEWKYNTSYVSSKTEKDKIIKEREKILKEQVFYEPRHIWKILAFYCKFHSYKRAKSALKVLQNLHYAQKTKGWKPIIKRRFQEMFMPMFFSEENYKFANVVKCEILKKEKKGVYKASLLKGIEKEDDLFKFGVHYTKEYLIIPKDDEHTESIDKIMKKGKTPVVVGTRDNPKRNILNNLIEIK